MDEALLARTTPLASRPSAQNYVVTPMADGFARRVGRHRLRSSGAGRAALGHPEVADDPRFATLPDRMRQPRRRWSLSSAGLRAPTHRSTPSSRRADGARRARRADPRPRRPARRPPGRSTTRCSSSATTRRPGGCASHVPRHGSRRRQRRLGAPAPSHRRALRRDRGRARAATPPSCERPASSLELAAGGTSASCRRQPLLGREHRGEQVAELVDPRRARRAASNTQLVVAVGAASTSSHVTGVDTVGLRPGPQASRRRSSSCAGCSGSSRRRPCPAAPPSSSTVTTSFGRCLLQQLADGQGERRRRARACSGAFSGTYSCRPFEPDVLGQPSRPTAAEHVADGEGDARALRDGRRRRRGRGRTRPCAASRGRRRGPSVRAARARPCWRPTPAPPARRSRSTRCCRCGRRARAPSAPTRAVLGQRFSKKPVCVDAVREAPEASAPGRRGGAASPARCGRSSR